MILVSGANGQLGQLVIAELLKEVDASRIVAGVRSPEKASDLAEQGVTVREFDYDRPATLAAALQDVSKLLLISSSEVGKRVAQHSAVIDAAKAAGVELLAYTSLLHADRSRLGLASEHRATELKLADSGLPHVLLRNGWYSENYLASVPMALEHGVVLGSAGDGKIASAPRANYAAAAAAVLMSEGQAGKVYELAGDTAYTLSEFAAMIAEASGRAVAYQDLPEAAFAEALVGAGLPQGLSDLLADSDVGASKGDLFDDGHQLSKLIGCESVPMSAQVAAAVG